MWYERSVEAATHPYSSPWWSWPLMLRPIAYWQNFPPQGKVATIWGGGNPLLWWGALTAITITAVRALERPNRGAHVPGLRLSWISRDLDSGRAHAVPVSLHAVGLPGLPGAGGDPRRCVAGRGRDVGMCRAARDDGAGVHAGTWLLGGTVPGRGAGVVCALSARHRDSSWQRSRFRASAMGAAAGRGRCS